MIVLAVLCSSYPSHSHDTFHQNHRSRGYIVAQPQPLLIIPAGLIAIQHRPLIFALARIIFWSRTNVRTARDGHHVEHFGSQNSTDS